MSIKTLVVDDTIVYRKILSEAVDRVPELELVAGAASGSQALKQLAQTPIDLVLLDVHMPEMDGVETLRRIRQDFPGIYVVMISGITTRSTTITIRALEIGAIDFIRKPDGKDQFKNMEQLVADLRIIVRLVELRSQAQPSRKPLPGLHTATTTTTAFPATPKTAPRMWSVPSKFAVCVIGVSTGGPEALNRLIPCLPATLSIPILIVQHMPQGFTRSLAESLNRKSKNAVVEASDGELLEAGTVYIAPGGLHMVVRKSGGGIAIGINDGPAENSCRPSVDVLFRSVAAAYEGSGVLAVVLTGMGNDGLNGVRALKRHGCYCITQEASSCVVYGMPRSVDEAGLSNLSLPIEKIADEICGKLRC